MKGLKLLLILVLASIGAIAQLNTTQVAVLDSLPQIATYRGGAKILLVKDSTKGGLLYLYTGASPVDSLNVFAGANSSKWSRTADGRSGSIITALDAAYTVTPTDYYVGLPTLTANRVITLPTVNAVNTGRTLVIRNANATGSTWTFSPAIVNAAGGSITPAPGNGKVYTLFCDGTNWVQISVI